MPVKKEPSGRRSVEAQAEVPGTPEAVWNAIATGPGISAWFVPTDVEEREGGTAVSHFGSGNSMDSVAKITVWEPPHRFVVETTEGPGTIATQWTVEARAGGTCVVRVVHSWFASTDDWDDQFEGHTDGWAAFFRILRLYLAHFASQRCVAFQLMGMAAPPKSAVWKALVRQLGLDGSRVGDHVRAAADAPPFAGVVERIGDVALPEEFLIRLDASPAPGLAHIMAHAMGDKVFLTFRFFFYGEQASAAAPPTEAAWQAWLAAQFPPIEE
ncbi:SRPBCC domain-containing protein [Reyranella sp. CPCC 100927]|uniref:SRPBCC family protein n=1 Tax=Reyranella sp. CPCC 100927 TaxID=2599616 RepID=UPI0011B6B570|nr:SRPBCC domain-containing protein [Reyranella sp. CPCC 100927]TWT11547.1 SRPBCC domain-containing protein [Reyranella sp. CPCC 100927]